MTARRVLGLTCLMALGAFVALAPGLAHAGAGASCAISATSLAFGRYVPSRSSPSDFTATISMTCTASGAVAVPIVGVISLTGSGPLGRELADGPNHLRYQLFLDPARTVLWGDGGGASHTKTVTGVVGVTTPFRAMLTVYGRILARQPDAVVGAYADQITAVLSY
jgi:spore coat protein U-like protein